MEFEQEPSPDPRQSLETNPPDPGSMTQTERDIFVPLMHEAQAGPDG